MKRTSPKRAAANRAAKPMLTEFRETFKRCWICGATTLTRTKHIHHIASGGGRVDDRRNLLMLCCVCHDEYVHTGPGKWHNNEGISMEYALKRLRDQPNYDRDWLNAARFIPPGAAGVTAEDVREATARVREFVKW